MSGDADVKARARGVSTALDAQFVHDDLTWAHDETRRPGVIIRCPCQRSRQVLGRNRIEVLRRLGVLALEGALQRHLQASERVVALRFPLAHYVNKPAG
jgi:hypothetical protein